MSVVDRLSTWDCVSRQLFCFALAKYGSGGSSVSGGASGESVCGGSSVWSDCASQLVVDFDRVFAGRTGCCVGDRCSGCTGGVDGGLGGSVCGSRGPAVGERAHGVDSARGGVGECGGVPGLQGVRPVASGPRGVTVSEADRVAADDGTAGQRGSNWERNQVWKKKKKLAKAARVLSKSGAGSDVPLWRRGAVLTGVARSEARSAVTVDTACAEEIEAKRTLAARRAAENKVATALAEHKLASLRDKKKTEALERLAAARVEERINTAKAKSQASYRKCASPVGSVGSALSAGEFAFKQDMKRLEASRKEIAYLRVQLDEYYKFATPAARQAVADIPEPYIPTDAEIDAEDDDESPYLSYEEMEADAAKWGVY